LKYTVKTQPGIARKHPSCIVKQLARYALITLILTAMSSEQNYIISTLNYHIYLFIQSNFIELTGLKSEATIRY